MADVRIVPLDPKFHDRKAFACGTPSLDRYIREQAAQDMRAKANSVFVMTPIDHPTQIAGFYTLCGVGIDPGQVPSKVEKRIPRYPQLSATLLGQLAVASTHQGRGLGRVLLVDALERAYRNTRQIGSVMVVTDPLDDQAAAFYAKYGFERFENAERMFLMMKTIEQLLDPG